MKGTKLRRKLIILEKKLIILVLNQCRHQRNTFLTLNAEKAEHYFTDSRYCYTFRGVFQACFVLFLFECVLCFVFVFFLFRVNKINDPTQTLNEFISIKSTSFSEDILCLFFPATHPVQCTDVKGPEQHGSDVVE